MKNAPHHKVTYVFSKRLAGWRLENDLEFDTFEELKTYLIEHTDELFNWINDNVKDFKTDYRELPNFKDAETVIDINTILDKYNYGWWFIGAEIISEGGNL